MKSNERSVQLRKEGNQLYSNRKFFDSLLKYNESLCLAPVGSENLGLAFANRSAVYCELKLFANCLKNIDLAKAHNYPQKDFAVLEKRAAKCHESLKQQTKLVDPWSFFKLSFKCNRKLPCAIDCLEFRVSEKYGKHIVTNQALRVGDILAIEKPFCSALLSESRFVEVDKSNKFQRCLKCLKDNQLDLIPCTKCCEGKKYSGETCRFK